MGSEKEERIAVRDDGVVNPIVQLRRRGEKRFKVQVVEAAVWKNGYIRAFWDQVAGRINQDVVKLLSIRIFCFEGVAGAFDVLAIGADEQIDLSGGRQIKQSDARARNGPQIRFLGAEPIGKNHRVQVRRYLGWSKTLDRDGDCGGMGPASVR